MYNISAAWAPTVPLSCTHTCACATPCGAQTGGRAYRDTSHLPCLPASVHLTRRDRRRAFSRPQALARPRPPGGGVGDTAGATALLPPAVAQARGENTGMPGEAPRRRHTRAPQCTTTWQARRGLAASFQLWPYARKEFNTLIIINIERASRPVGSRCPPSNHHMRRTLRWPMHGKSGCGAA